MNVCTAFDWNAFFVGVCLICGIGAVIFIRDVIALWNDDATPSDSDSATNVVEFPTCDPLPDVIVLPDLTNKD